MSFAPEILIEAVADHQLYPFGIDGILHIRAIKILLRRNEDEARTCSSRSSPRRL
jgi:hypothetical protein